MVSPREVFQAAFLAHAADIVLCHNHPSGDPPSSPANRALTQRLVSVDTTLGIEILNHVVTGHDSYYSFKEAGLLRRAFRSHLHPQHQPPKRSVGGYFNSADN